MITSTATNGISFSLTRTIPRNSLLLLVSLEHSDDGWIASIETPIDEFGWGETALGAMRDLFLTILDYERLLERHPEMPISPQECRELLALAGILQKEKL